MKHLGKISVIRDCARGQATRTEPDFADAKNDLMNALWRAFSDYAYQKKNEVGI